MTEQEYRENPAVNKSTLWYMRKSPLHYKHAVENPGKDTPALRIGRAIHAAILTPDEFEAEYAVEPKIDRRTKEGKELYARFLMENEGKNTLSMEENETVQAIAEAVRKNREAAALLEGCVTELPLLWTDEATGIACKCRVDALRKDKTIAVDLKTCQNADTDSFARDAIKYGYDVQAAHYLRGVKSINGNKPVEWYFIAVEKAEPYAVNVIKAGDDFLDRGTWQLISLMDKLQACRESNEWPGYGTNELILPAWAGMIGEE